MKVLILAGGGGTRLWPLSRQSWPKQFLNLSGNPQGSSLLVETIERCLDEEVSAFDIYIVTGASLLPQVHHELQKADLPEILSNVICEPCRRNTAPAIALAAQFIRETSKNTMAEDEVLAILPADHVVLNEMLFREDLHAAGQLAQDGYIVTLGITPTRPETGFGYIEAAEGSQEAKWAKVHRFVEKPDHVTACEYLDSGRYLWNAGIFVMTVRTLLRAFEQHAPEIHQLLSAGYPHVFQHFAEMPNISIDYAIMEHADKMAVLPLRAPWSDLGSWDNVYEKLEKDIYGNALYGTQAQLIDSRGSLIWSETGRFIGAIGLEDYLVVDTPDALLISKKGDSQSVREIIETLDGEKSSLTQALPYQREAWGEIKAMASAGESYQLTLAPHQQLEVRTEKPTLWAVVSGRGYWQHSQEKHSLQALFSWNEEASCQGFIRVEGQEMTLICLGDKPEVKSSCQELREIILT